MVIKLDMIQAVALAVIVLFIGQKTKNKLTFLDKYCIPAPVVGGLLFVFLTLILKLTNILTFDMDITLQAVFMTAFFTTIGFTASLSLLKKGGKQVFIFLAITTVLIILQDITGVTLAKIFGLSPIIGLCTGSVPMVGGHGTSAAFGPLFEAKGITGATTVALAAATFGLVMGSMIGGPIGKKLLEKNNISYPMKTVNSKNAKEATVSNEDTKKPMIPENFMGAASQILLAMGIGTIISALFEKAGLTFPGYIGGMLAAAVLRNISDATKEIGRAHV